MTTKYTGRLVTSEELLALFAQSTESNRPVILVMPEGNDGDFINAMEVFDYIDNQMLAYLTDAFVYDEDSISAAFDASEFETHNKPFERAQFFAAHGRGGMLTARQKYAEQNKPFSMKDDAYFERNEKFFVVEDFNEFLDKPTSEESESVKIEIMKFIADMTSNEPMKRLASIGYLTCKIHAKTATNAHKKVLQKLLSE